MRLWVEILLGLFSGVFIGAILGPHAAVFKPVGDIFINLISMIIVPLILSSIVIGITNSRISKQIGSMAITTMVMFMSTMAGAVLLGMVVAGVLKPGEGLNLTMPIATAQPDAPTLGAMMLNLVPPNPIMALVEGNILQVIVFAIFLGIALNMTGERGRPLTELFESLADVLYKLTSVVMRFSPFGVFIIMTWVSGTFGFSAVYVQLKFLFIYCAACVFFVLTVFGSILWFGAKVSPWPLFRGMADAIAFAFSTCSSSATLPLAMTCIQKNVGVSRNVASFVMPVGSILNRSGSAIYQGMGVLFVAQAYGIELVLSDLFLVLVTAMFSVIAAAGVPGAGFVMLSYVMTAVGVPVEGLALFIGIDRARDMCSTMLNTFGTAVCAVYIACKEGELDERQYYSERLFVLEGDEV